MAQEQIRPQHREGDPTPPDAVPTAPLATNLDNAALDSMLDEIDSVLEVNAEEFVKGFVQKGGQ